MIELRWYEKPMRKAVSHMPSLETTVYQKVLQYRLVLTGGDWQDVPIVAPATEAAST